MDWLRETFIVFFMGPWDTYEKKHTNIFFYNFKVLRPILTVTTVRNNGETADRKVVTVVHWLREHKCQLKKKLKNRKNFKPKFKHAKHEYTYRIRFVERNGWHFWLNKSRAISQKTRCLGIKLDQRCQDICCAVFFFHPLKPVTSERQFWGNRFFIRNLKQFG